MFLTNAIILFYRRTGSELDWKKMQSPSRKNFLSSFRRKRPDPLRLKGGSGNSEDVGNQSMNEAMTGDAVGTPQPPRRKQSILQSAVKAIFFVKVIEPAI